MIDKIPQGFLEIAYFELGIKNAELRMIDKIPQGFLEIALLAIS